MQIKFNGVTRIENQLLILPKKTSRVFEFPKNMIAQYGGVGGKNIRCLDGGKGSGGKSAPSSSRTRGTASPRKGAGDGDGGDDGWTSTGEFDFDSNATVDDELLGVLYEMHGEIEKNISIFRYIIENDYLDAFRERSMLDMSYDSLYKHLESSNNIKLCIDAVKAKLLITKNSFEIRQDLKHVRLVGSRALGCKKWLVSSVINFGVLKSDLGLLTRIMSDLDVAVEYSRFAMSIAVVEEAEDVVDFLLNFGLDLSLDDFIQVAISNRSYRIVRLLTLAKDNVPGESGQ